MTKAPMTMAMSETLKPCPFCEGKPVILTHVENENKVRLMCGVATCGAAITWWNPRDEAIAAWNRRASDAQREAAEAMLAALVAICKATDDLLDVEEYDLEPTMAKRQRAQRQSEAAWSKVRKAIALARRAGIKEGATDK